MIDWRGNEYDVGDLILYPQGDSSACMVEARVLEIAPATAPRWRNHPGVKVKVQPIRGGYFWSNRKLGGGGAVEGLPKPVWLTTVTNITKVADE